MKIRIIGTAHKIQDLAADDSLAARKKLLEKYVRHMIYDHTPKVEFIGEEARFTDDAGNHPCETIARKVAESEPGKVRWRNIDMPKAARDVLGITDEQKNRQRNEMLDGELFFKETRVPSDAIREAFMVWRAIKEAGQVESILIICGNLHVAELAEILKAQGHEVATEYLHDYS